MSEFNDYIEVSARTEEDALTEAAIKLETTSDKLEYEVIDKGSSGFLGFIGSKPVVIRVRKKAETPVSSDVQEDVSLEERSEAPAEKKITEEQAPSSDAPAESFTEKILAEEEPVNDEELIEAARDFTSRIFQAMGEEVNTTISMDDEEKTMDIEFSGPNMGMLIGKRGQTLDSIQYLISLVVNKKSPSYIRVRVDTENYRDRRKATLENLAKNIAFKVKRSRHSVVLEPMNPYERRIIHSALQDDKFVETHSEGDEPYRNIVVTLKKEYRDRPARGSYGRNGYGRGGRGKGGYRSKYNRDGRRYGNGGYSDREESSEKISGDAQENTSAPDKSVSFESGDSE